MSQVSYGTITITDMNDIEEIYTIYAGSNTETSPTFTYATVTDGTTWKRNASALSGFKYIWQSTVVTKSGVTVDSTNWQQFYSQPVRLTGLEGDDARNITDITPYYYLSTSDSSQTGGSWSTTPQPYPSTGTAYYWTKTITTYDSGSPTESTAVLDMFLTNAAKDARDANTNATIANSIASHANENAQGALSISRATQQHFWFNSTTTGTIEAGAYITDTPIDTFKSGKNGGYLLARSDGIILGKGVNRYMELSGSELKFYKAGTTDSTASTASNVAAKLDSAGLEIANGGIKAGSYNSTATDANQNFVYLSSEDYGTGVKIGNSSSDKSDWRQIIGKNFGVDKAGNLYASGANIQGKITITSGSNVYTKTEADAAYDAKGAASAVQTNIEGVAVQEEQYIYISKASGTASVSGTTTWITEAGDKQNTWSTKRPTYNSSYPVLFVAKQKKVVSGTVTCTTPVKDDTTTIIDGGHITTGTIDASKATIKNISASMFTSSEQEKILNSKIEIGGRNLVWDTEWNHISTRWSDWGSPTTRKIVTINGKRWLHLVTTASSYQGYSQAPDKRNGYGEIKAGDKVIISYSAYAKTAGQTCTVGCHWRNSSGTIVAQNWFPSTLTTTEKRYTSGVFTIPNNAVGFNVMVGDGTANAQELWISQVKIEFGTKATDWTPAPEDIQSNAKDYADTVASTAASTAKAELDATKIDVVGESTSLLDNINAISDQITLLASRINFGNITVADNLAQLNTAVSIDTATSTVYVGDQSNFHVRINGTELGFYQRAQRVAYINNNQLYITQSVVLQQMDLGIPVANGGLGQWSWKVHPNGQNPSRNNLNLKWIG